VFKAVFSIMLGMALLLLLVLPQQTPGSAARTVTVMTLAIQAVAMVLSLAALYFEWEPFYFLDA
jgi:uncharacterized membrane protein